VTRYVSPERDVGLQGHYAGICTRFVGFLFDLTAVVFLWAVFTRVIEYLVSELSGSPWKMSNLPVASWALLIAWAVFFCAYPVAAGGRTFGMAIAGLRVVRPDGTAVGGRQAIVRVLALPLSFLTLGIGFLLIVLRRDGRALQDLIGGTAVVYAWDARAARLRFLARSAGDQVTDGPAAGSLETPATTSS
jgi:uncharacterized RDD family membrane protein YckC